MTTSVGHVAIFDCDLRRASELRHDVLVPGAWQIETVLLGGSNDFVVPSELDVAVVGLGQASAEGLVAAVECLNRDPSTEVVFYLIDAGSSSEALSTLLGAGRVLTLDRLLAWLRAALVPLARAAQARRTIAECKKMVPPLPPIAAAGGSLLPLYDAERRFRTAYLKQLLADSPSRQVAASRAGVPYRTLCAMMQKLDIDQPCQPERRQVNFLNGPSDVCRR